LAQIYSTILVQQQVFPPLMQNLYASFGFAHKKKHNETTKEPRRNHKKELSLIVYVKLHVIFFGACAVCLSFHTVGKDTK